MTDEAALLNRNYKPSVQNVLLLLEERDDFVGVDLTINRSKYLNTFSTPVV